LHLNFVRSKRSNQFVMKYFLLGILSFLAVSALPAQKIEPVKWNFTANKIAENEYDLVLTANLQKGWFIYSQYLESEDGPVPTSIELLTPSIELLGKATEDGHKKEGHDPIFDMNLVKYSQQVKFIQRIKVTPGIKQIDGEVMFMTCDDNMCLPPTATPFAIILE